MNISSDQPEHILKELREDSRVLPSDAFRSNARIRILNVLAMPERTAVSHRFVPGITRFVFRFALIVLLSMIGVSYAAGSSLPGSPFFPVKVLGERIALALSPTTKLKTTVANAIINRRIHEIEQVQKSGDDKATRQSYRNFTDEVKMIEDTKNIYHNVVNQTIQEHENILDPIRQHEEEQKKEDHDQEEEENSDSKSPTPTVEQNKEVPTPTVSPKPVLLESPIPLFQKEEEENDDDHGDD